MNQLDLFSHDCAAVRRRMTREEYEVELDLWTKCAMRLLDLIPGKQLDHARTVFADLNAFYDTRVQSPADG